MICLLCSGKIQLVYNKEYSKKVALCKECLSIQNILDDFSENKIVKKLSQDPGKELILLGSLIDYIVTGSKGKEKVSIFEIGASDNRFAKLLLTANPFLNYSNVVWLLESSELGIKRNYKCFLSEDSKAANGKPYRNRQNLYGKLKHDFIVFQNSFSYFSKPREVIKNLLSVLKDSGEIIIDLPVADLRFKNSQFWEFVNESESFYWNIGRLKLFMREFDLNLVKVFHFPEFFGGYARLCFSREIRGGLRHFSNPPSILQLLENSLNNKKLD